MKTGGTGTDRNPFGVPQQGGKACFQGFDERS